LRQNKKRAKRNRYYKNKLKKVSKKLQTLIDEGKKEEAEETLPQLMRAADRAAAKGPLHKNKASRIKSKMARRVNDLS